MSDHLRGDEVLAEFLKVEDPLERLRLLTEVVHEAQAIQNDYLPHRIKCVEELVADDRSRRWIARKLGVTPQSVAHLWQRRET